MAEDWRDGGFGVYVHWPFCAAKCPYCDFNSHVSRDIDHGRWRRALLEDLRYMASLAGPRRVESVFFGGGTPSLMPPDTVAALVAEVGRLFSAGDDLEVTLEANPTSVEAARFAGYRDAGVNRFSLGIQSLIDADLRALGRQHTAAEALAAIDVAQSTGARVSIDLIYGRQHQAVADWEVELTRALATGVRHISLYQLTIEPATAFGALHRRGKLKGLPDGGVSADFFELTEDLCRRQGMHRYEVSNHCVSGEECRHNLVYWRYGDYLGIGPGAHGRVSTGGRRLATWSVLQPEAWLDHVERNAPRAELQEALSPRDQAIEYVLLGLRTPGGLSLDRVRRLDPSILKMDRIRELSDENMVKIKEGRLVATDTGIQFLNLVVEEIL